MKNWTEKYRPTKFTEIIGQREAIQTVKNFLEIFPKSKKKALIFYGPPGTGKTLIARQIAKALNANEPKVRITHLP